MTKVRPGALAVVVIAMVVLSASPRAQLPTDPPPPVPYEDIGACPFEGCAYREWTAANAVTVRTDRKAGAPIAFTLRRGENVVALGGVVVTIKAGRVEFREPITLNATPARIQIGPGQTLYLLTYQGEGFTKAWFHGRLYTDVDTVQFFNGMCDRDPSRCAGKIVEKSQTEWWVQIRNRVGKTGWVLEDHSKFNGRDAIGKR